MHSICERLRPLTQHLIHKSAAGCQLPWGADLSVIQDLTTTKHGRMCYELPILEKWFHHESCWERIALYIRFCTAIAMAFSDHENYGKSYWILWQIDIYRYWNSEQKRVQIYNFWMVQICPFTLQVVLASLNCGDICRWNAPQEREELRFLDSTVWIWNLSKWRTYVDGRNPAPVEVGSLCCRPY